MLFLTHGLLLLLLLVAFSLLTDFFFIAWLLFDNRNTMKRNIMATSQLLTHTEMFDEMIVGVITNLRRKYQRANCERMHKEIAE